MIRTSIQMFAVALTCISCAPQNDARLSELQKQIDEMTVRLEEFKAQLDDQKADASLKELFATFDKIAYLTPGADGYSLVSYDLGVLTVKIDDVKPYANGSRIVLQFGNPMAATIRGLKMELDWGKINDNGVGVSESEKTKPFTLTQELSPGRWSSIPFVLEGIPPSELGYVRVHDVSHTGIRLTGG